MKKRAMTEEEKMERTVTVDLFVTALASKNFNIKNKAIEELFKKYINNDEEFAELKRIYGWET